MVPMKALVGFADRSLATEFNPSGAQSANREFDAPSAEIATRLANEGLAERAKPTQAAAKS